MSLRDRTPEVVRVQTDTNSGYSVEITIARARWDITVGYPGPSVDDVPPDIRDALRAWLDGARTTDRRTE